jgi:hypothetical protein
VISFHDFGSTRFRYYFSVPQGFDHVTAPFIGPMMLTIQTRSSRRFWKLYNSPAACRSKFHTLPAEKPRFFLRRASLERRAKSAM